MSSIETISTRPLAADKPSDPPASKTWKLALAALGVVYGDIGTSPLYALRECFHPEHGIAATPDNVLGILSLVIWALILVVVVKYLGFVLQADNHGEGGILALLALVSKPAHAHRSARRRVALVLMGLFGASLLYADGIITPAISVLGAIEGLEVATPVFTRWVVPITLVILVGLFLIQRRGTAGIGAVFGPATLLWFAAISMTGLPWVVRSPHVLAAFHPGYALGFLTAHGLRGFLVLGSVFLVVTGSEALYADMGHFGRRPIRLAWFWVACPALLVNYLGQGALLISGAPGAAANPFYALVSGVWIYPLVAIATLAAVIASQALISGAFSLTNQAVQLGYCPRLRIVHTSGEHEGQIYVPEVNWALMLACLGVVVGFQNSSALAAAYGIAVTGTMMVTSVLFYAVMRERWGQLPALLVLGAFLAVDLAFFGANLVKVAHGGWLPLAFGVAIFTIFTTWKRGRRALGERLHASAVSLDPFMQDLARQEIIRVPGTAVFMSGNPDAVPLSLVHQLKHCRSLHERVVLLSIVTEHVPAVYRRERVSIRELGHGCYHVVARFGFMQSPRVPDILRQFKRLTAIDISLQETSFYLGRETLIATGRSGMWRWRVSLFSALSRNAPTATEFFGLPAGRVVELGMQIEL